MQSGEESCRLAVTCSTAELSRAHGGLAVSAGRGPHFLNSLHCGPFMLGWRERREVLRHCARGSGVEVSGQACEVGPRGQEGTA